MYANTIKVLSVLMCAILIVLLSSCSNSNNALIYDKEELPTQNNTNGEQIPNKSDVPAQSEPSDMTQNTGNSNNDICLPNERLRVLIENCKYIGKTAVEFKELLGELSRGGEPIDGITTHRVQGSEMSFLFEGVFPPESGGACIGFSGTLNSLFPDLTEMLTMELINEKFDALTTYYHYDYYVEGYYTVIAYFDSIPELMRTKYSNEINSEAWAGIVAVMMDIVRLEGPDEIRPDSSFKVFLTDKMYFPPWEEGN